MLAQVVGDPSSSGLGELGPGLAGSALVVLVLLVVTLLVLRVVYGARRRPRSGGLLEVISQVELSPGQSLYLVRAAGRCLLVGGSSGGLGLISELDPAQVAAASAPGTDRETMAQQLRARFLGTNAPTAATGTVTHADHATPRHADLKATGTVTHADHAAPRHADLKATGTVTHADHAAPRHADLKVS